MLNNPIQNQLDFILFEEGTFSPLTWLLRDGHLDYNDYLDWRKTRTKYLEDHFTTPITTLITALETAGDYAGLLKLESSRATYLSTHNQVLHFCRSTAHELIFTTVYEPAQDRKQMDLFFDSAESCAVSSLVSAIVEGRSPEIAALLAKLDLLNPDKYLQFKQLLACVQEIRQTSMSSDAKIILLLQKITPQAFALLGRFTLDFLTPLWHKISFQIADLHFDSASPQNHLSFTAFKEFQWQTVLLSIERENNWNNQPLLIFRYAESCFKLNREREGITYWCQLFIRFPEHAERLIKDTSHRLMHADWQFFNELDPELESSLFPAWLLLHKPALSLNTVGLDLNENEPLQLLAKLVGNKEEVVNAAAINYRARLQQISPSLFVHYMKIHTGTQP